MRNGFRPSTVWSSTDVGFGLQNRVSKPVEEGVPWILVPFLVGTGSYGASWMLVPSPFSNTADSSLDTVVAMEFHVFLGSISVLVPWMLVKSASRTMSDTMFCWYLQGQGNQIIPGLPTGFRASTVWACNKNW